MDAQWWNNGRKYLHTMVHHWRLPRKPIPLLHVMFLLGGSAIQSHFGYLFYNTCLASLNRVYETSRFLFIAFKRSVIYLLLLSSLHNLLSVYWLQELYRTIAEKSPTRERWLCFDVFNSKEEAQWKVDRGKQCVEKIFWSSLKSFPSYFPFILKTFLDNSHRDESCLITVIRTIQAINKAESELEGGNLKKWANCLHQMLIEKLRRGGSFKQWSCCILLNRVVSKR